MGSIEFINLVKDFGAEEPAVKEEQNAVVVE